MKCLGREDIRGLIVLGLLVLALVAWGSENADRSTGVAVSVPGRPEIKVAVTKPRPKRLPDFR